MRHTHKYQRATLGKRYRIYKCVLPGCAHYVSAQLLKNRIAVCWRCEEEFQITAELAELARPHCKFCTKGRKELPAAFEDAFAKLVPELFKKEEDENGADSIGSGSSDNRGDSLPD